MVQPKTPPLSIRLDGERLARVMSFAGKHKLSRHLALLTLIDAGLKALGPGLPSPEAQAKIKSTVAERRAKPRQHVSRLKGEWKAP